MTGRGPIIVTGGSGFVGRRAAKALLSLGFETHVIDLRDPEIDGVVFHQFDLLRGDGLSLVLHDIGAERLLHLAWCVAPGRFWTDPANLDWTAASLRLFRAFADEGGTRIVGAGTCAEYDWALETLDERTTPLAPRTVYGAAKAATGTLLDIWGGGAGVSTAWGRLFFLYGPGEARGRLVSDLCASLLAGQRVACTDGKQIRDFMHVDDVGRAYALLAASDCKGPVNIASGSPTSVRLLIELVAEKAGRRDLVDFGARSRAENDPPVMTAATQRLIEEVGFRPHYSLEKGLADTIEWWRGKQGAL